MCRSYSAIDDDDDDNDDVDDDGLSEHSEMVVDVATFTFLGSGGTTMPALLALSGRCKFLNLVLS